jgi:thiamine kinase-like enzyme
MSLKDNNEIMIIDYEYAGWNPMAMDLANYVNETMIDNNFFHHNGKTWYPENCMSDAEIEAMCKEYLKRYFFNYMDENVKKNY